MEINLEKRKRVRTKKQEDVLIVQEKKQEKVLAKQTRSRAKTKTPKILEAFATTSLDEIDLDDMTLADIIDTKGKSFDEITESINELVTEQEILPVNEHTSPLELIKQQGSLDSFEDKIINQELREVTPKYVEQKPYRTTSEYNRLVGKNSPQDNLRTWASQKHERNNRGFLNKIKNFFSEVKEEVDSLSEKIGWDEKAELEKNRLQLEQEKARYEALAEETRKDIVAGQRDLDEENFYKDNRAA